MDWVLPLFADGPLQGSVLVPILLGVLVATVMSEWFGWSFSGIVVPGYLTPIVIIAPFSAAVIALEAILTLLLVRLVTDVLPRRGWWAPLFGRDRFLVIFYLSVVVRLLLELGVLPGLEQMVQQAYPEIDFRNRFTGIGLVVVPLLANAMWKPGILRGFGQVVITTTLTWLLLTRLLVPWTNFNLGQFYLLYETMALDFAASPTAYILLLIGALLAAQINLYLGWDFNGIMVPTLLAISLFRPLSFALTFVDALAIFAAAWLLVRLPGLRRLSFEGPRLVAVMYAIGLGLKLLLEHANLHPGALFGDPHLSAYGYLLSTLIAAKMWQKHHTIRILVPIIQVAALIALIGGAAIWGFNALAEVTWRQRSAALLGRAPGAVVRREQGDLLHVVKREQTRFLRPGGGVRVERMQAFEQQLFTEIVRGCARLAADGEPDHQLLERYAALAERLGCELFLLDDETTDDRLLILRESPLVPTYRGWGLIALRLNPAGPLTVFTPRPLADRGAAAAAAALADLTRAGALVLPGAHFQTNADGSADPLRWARLPMRLALFTLSDAATLEVRVRAQARLWVAGALSDQLRLRDLQIWLGGDLAIDLAPTPPPANIQLLRPGRGAYAGLILDRRAIGALIGHRILGRRGEDAARVPIRRGLHQVQAACAELRATPFAAGLRSWNQNDLLFIEEQVLWPLLESAAAGVAGDTNLADLLLLAAAENARRIGYRLELIERDRGERFALLVETAAAHRGQGTFLLRLGNGQPIHLLVPQPVSIPGSLDAALALLDQLQASALSIGPLGITDSGRRDRDRLQRFEQESLYQLVHQVIQRRWWKVTPMLSLELRGSSDLDTDLLLREGAVIGGEEGLSATVAALVARFRHQGWSVRVVGDRPGDETYGLGANRQLAYSTAYQGGPFVGLWLSRALRARLRFDREDTPHLQALRQLGLLGEPVHLAETIRRHLAQAPLPVPPVLGREALAYARDRNLRRIELLAEACAAAGIPLALYQDRDSNALICILGAGPELLVVDLGAWEERHISLDPEDPERAIHDLLINRARSLGPAVTP